MGRSKLANGLMAPPHGVFVVSWPFLRSNWGAINPFASLDRPIEMDLDGFSYAFTNHQKPDDQKRLYERYYVPESRRIAKGPLSDIANIDETKTRGPLLVIAGSEDHIIPARLN